MVYSKRHRILNWLRKVGNGDYGNWHYFHRLFRLLLARNSSVLFVKACCLGAIAQASLLHVCDGDFWKVGRRHRLFLSTVSEGLRGGRGQTKVECDHWRGDVLAISCNRRCPLVDTRAEVLIGRAGSAASLSTHTSLVVTRVLGKR